MKFQRIREGQYLGGKFKHYNLKPKQIFLIKYSSETRGAIDQSMFIDSEALGKRVKIIAFEVDDEGKIINKDLEGL